MVPFKTIKSSNYSLNGFIIDSTYKLSRLIIFSTFFFLSIPIILLLNSSY